MKKKFALEWARALESGKYKQGKFALKKDNKFCCLGVLCNLHEGKAEKKASGDYFGDSLLFQSKICDYVGFKSFIGTLPDHKGKFRSLAQLNDLGYSFKKIAKLIRRYWRYL